MACARLFSCWTALEPSSTHIGIARSERAGWVPELRQADICDPMLVGLTSDPTVTGGSLPLRCDTLRNQRANR